MLVQAEAKKAFTASVFSPFSVSIQQKSHFPSLPFVLEVFLENLFVALDIPGQIQFQLNTQVCLAKARFMTATFFSIVVLDELLYFCVVFT